MTSAFKVILKNWDEARTEAFGIRQTVFVMEQGVPAAVEIDEHDPESEHAIAYDAAGNAVATGRLLPDGHIGRMAVLRDWRGRGAGAAVLSALIERAREREFSILRLSSQTHAVAFYRRFGFEPEGEPYLDVGIPHVDMSRALGDQ